MKTIEQVVEYANMQQEKFSAEARAADDLPGMHQYLFAVGAYADILQFIETEKD